MSDFGDAIRKRVSRASLTQRLSSFPVLSAGFPPGMGRRKTPIGDVMFKKVLQTMAAVMIFCLSPHASMAAEPVKVPTAWLGEQEAFPMWYAKEKGWDAEAGLDVQMHLFGSGSDILNALPSGQWVYAGMGAVPAMLGNLRYDTSIIALGNDESACNAVMVHPDSPIAKARGWNKDYPDVLGSPDTVKGKTFLVTTLSSAHYALSSWLDILGLTTSDIVIKNTNQARALELFEDKACDGVALWAPHMFVAADKGAVMAADMRAARKGNPVVLVADTAYAEKHPEVTAAFLGVYLRAVDRFKHTPAEELVAEYLRFYKTFVGQDYDEALALRDLQCHPLFTLEEQLALFDDADGPSQVQRWQSAIAVFFKAINRITAEESTKVEDGTYVTGKYLKLVK